MDFLNLRKQTGEQIRKFRPVLIVILAGILLMCFTGTGESPESETQQPPQTPDFEQRLEKILSCIQGAGNVRVLLSQDSGELTVYQSDEDRSGTGGDYHRDTVVISDRDRQELGLVRQIIPPKYRGAVVLAQGADNPKVELAIKEAVRSAAGLTADKVTVLKMK